MPEEVIKMTRLVETRNGSPRLCVTCDKITACFWLPFSKKYMKRNNNGNSVNLILLLRRFQNSVEHILILLAPATFLSVQTKQFRNRSTVESNATMMEVRQEIL